jgi:hypothetical protein
MGAHERRVDNGSKVMNSPGFGFETEPSGELSAGFDLKDTPEAACRGRFVGLVNQSNQK